MQDYEMIAGRPDVGTRDAAEEASYEFLDGLGVAYQRVDHEQLYTMEALAPVQRALGCTVAKNLFLTNRQQTEFYLLLMPCDKPFKTKYLSAQLGCSRLSFGSEAQLQALLGVSHGSASVLCLLRDSARPVRLLADRDLKDAPWFACHPCRNSSTLRLSTADLLDKLLPALAHPLTWVELPREID